MVKIIGEKQPLSYFLDKEIFITDYNYMVSKKNDGHDHYYEFQVSTVENGIIKHYKSWNSGNAIITFFDWVKDGKQTLPIKTVVRERYKKNSFYFEGYDFEYLEKENELNEIILKMIEEEKNNNNIKN